MDIEIVPGDRVGPIQIGQKRSEVLFAAGSPDNRFRKTQDSLTLTDVYDSLGVHVYYTMLDTVEFLEAFAVEGVRHLVSGSSGFTTKADQVISALSSQGHIFSQDEGYTFIFHELGVTLWRSDVDDPFFEAIGVARPGYFDEGAA